MKLFYRIIVALSLLSLVGIGSYAAYELRQIRIMFDAIRGEIPMGH